MTAIRIRWWMTVAAVLVFLILPGADHSPFSGAPLASKAIPVFFAVVLAGIFSILFPRRRAPRWIWLVLLILLIAGKIALAPRLVPGGWRGTYWTPTEWTGHVTTLRVANFVTEHRIRTYRIDRAIAFDGVNFSFDFFNDSPPEKRDALMTRRDVSLPLRMRWEGWIPGGTPQRLAISCRGHVKVSAGTVPLLEANNTARQPVDIPVGTGTDPIVIEYFKPAGVTPMIKVEGLSVIVTPGSYTRTDLSRSAHAETAITLLGLLCIFVFAAAFVDAYAPLRTLPGVVLSEPFALATFIVLAIIVISSAVHTIPARHSTVLLPPYDDPLAYEGYARDIVRHGLLMLDSAGHGSPYYFYPLYSYALAGAHLLFGEDFVTITLFNDLCRAAAVFLTWVWLRKRVGAFAGIVIVLLVWSLLDSTGYALSAFSDNLFVPFVVATLLTANSAIDRRSRPMFFLAGVLTALGAATRPSFLMFLPFLGLWILIDKTARSALGRFAAAAAYGAGFIIAIAPFTIRNWIVSGKLILLVNGGVNLPLFLTPPESPRIKIAGLPGLGESLLICLDYFRQHPILTIATELRKAAFTFGMPFGPAAGVNPPWHFMLYPILFAFAVWLRRMPRNFQSVAVVFLLSHFTAMVAAAPWTYGYKTIIPFHLVMLIGTVFLIPVQRFRRLPASHPETGTDPTVAVIALNDNSTPAGLQHLIAEATADFILFTPDGQSTSADTRKLLAYAGEFDVVDGIPGDSLGWGWNGIVAKYVGALYDELTLVDAASTYRLVRREVAESIAANLSGAGKKSGVEMTLRILNEGLPLIQIPVSESRRTRVSGSDAIRLMVFASVKYRKNRRRPSETASIKPEVVIA